MNEEEILQEAAGLTTYWQKAVELCMEHGPRILLAILLLIAGFWLIKRLTGVLRKRLTHKKIDASVTPFLVSLINAAAKVLLIIVVASMLGVETTSFVAAIGAITLAVGMALQGSLANFAGGIV